LFQPVLERGKRDKKGKRGKGKLPDSEIVPFRSFVGLYHPVVRRVEGRQEKDAVKGQGEKEDGDGRKRWRGIGMLNVSYPKGSNRGYSGKLGELGVRGVMERRWAGM